MKYYSISNFGINRLFSIMILKIVDDITTKESKLLENE